MLKFGKNFGKMAGGANEKRGAGKSVVIAYICWLLGGIFGLHLFYLRRDAHGFLTWSTAGGYGLGWLADITKIPRYVREVNEDPELMKEIYRKMREHKKVSLKREKRNGKVEKQVI